jgi:glutathionylspermidine synthase
MNLRYGFDKIKPDYIKYFKEYVFEKPIITTQKTNEELRQLGLILYKAIDYLLCNYKDFLHLMPRCEKDLQIFDICRQYKYQVGTFRTDFVVDANNQIKIIEITTRQPLNGYFTSGFFRDIGLEQIADTDITKQVNDLYPEFFTYLQNYIGNVRHICVIKGDEKLEEIKIYPSVFEKAGIDCHIIPLNELAEKLHLLDNAWVIEELTFNEIRNLPLEIIDKLAQLPLHNNFLSLLHTHDKRFFALLADKTFLDCVLDSSEQDLLAKYLVPSYIWNEPSDIWENALKNKDNYILKHQHKGKSVDIYAGLVTDETTWRKLFEKGTIENYILQPFINQKKFKGIIADEVRNDYVAGTLLYFNDNYFGTGLYRTSSHPVTNIKDNRKIAQIVISSNESKEDYHYL